MQGLRSGFIGHPAHPRPAPVRAPTARVADPARRPARRDPAPSRLVYRLNRIWLTPLYRRVVRVGLPAFLLCLVVGLWLDDPDRRAQLTASFESLIDSVQHRDEFMVKAMRIDGASDNVDKALRAMLAKPLPASSFDLDLEALRSRVMQLDAIEKVELRILPDGVLSAVVTEREPVALWRHERGIDMIDATGHRVTSVASREERLDLPVIAGAGADRAASEALVLIDAAGPILPRLRGLERIGERRWDVVLDRGQRIMLSADGALKALERAIAMDQQTGLLDRDVTGIDLRDPNRVAIRLGHDARNAIRHARGEEMLDPEGLPLPEDAGQITTRAVMEVAGSSTDSGEAESGKILAERTARPGVKPAT